ncbi:haloacid dehalogenase superfamily protein, subfamily IA, variant 3 with third motif having DD or ED [Sphaerochaeta pleomorpha str. Grapes]|uniref:Haloacid dehalogenase superfamily protein, subfamily IA, variant 3 with third motif having DD or ED n=1 Tax=Sphaerochaeta pleomorpha (strain ATCC BAA-1885 / DSM 22778 / Grapes) TaxID=158190 RepID=G8QRT6_SPHPG|nr:HAD-IA family hydrolase [Sphaerochaeta pleomorpha]AEV28869.1 haloacid dehalogenase superfamily protein, subfamily IA, variant 3 with third motif having DD or ED [Sphaerochaeta pleomorpha str. Grapes]
MFDICCEAFSSSCLLLPSFEQRLASEKIPLGKFPLQTGNLPMNRCLLFSDKQEILDEAKRMGYGTFGVGTSLKADYCADSLEDESVYRPLFTSWSDKTEGCTLFIFDMGNVVIKNIHMLKKVARKWHLNEKEFIEDYQSYNSPMMDGFISTSDYWGHVKHKFGITVEGEPFAQEFTPVFNEEMVALLKRLSKEGKRVVCGSNTFAPHWEIIERMGALALFDKAYASHEMGVSKPARQFFEYILEKEGCKASKAYFIDDYEENIESASKLGIKCLLYVDGYAKSASEKLNEVFGS